MSSPLPWLNDGPPVTEIYGLSILNKGVDILRCGLCLCIFLLLRQNENESVEQHKEYDGAFCKKKKKKKDYRSQID